MDDFEPKACPFFRSYYDSVQKLEDKDRLDFYELVLEFFFEAEPPEGREKTAIAEALFTLTKPVIEKSKAKAKAGAKGGKSKSKQNTSKMQAEQNSEERELQANGNGKEMERKWKGDGDGDGDGEEMDSEATASVAGESLPQRENVPFIQIQEAYNSICSRLPAIKSIDGDRRKKTSSFFKKYGFETMTQIFHLANESDFLCGCGNTGFTAKFDWIIKTDNANKILEGNYTNNEQFTGQRNHSQPESRGFVGHAIEMMQQHEDHQWAPPNEER